MTILRSAFSAISVCIIASGQSAWAGAQQLEMQFQPVLGLVTAGDFPVPVNPADLGNVSGTIALFQDMGNPTFFAIDVNQTGLQLPGFVVDSLAASIVISSGVITSAVFGVVMNDGSFFNAVGAHGGSLLDIEFSNNEYTISGAITDLQLSGPLLAGVDVSGPFGAQPLVGSFFDFSFTPAASNGVDFETQLLFNVMGPNIVPLPSAFGLGTVGLCVIAQRRRRH